MGLTAGTLYEFGPFRLEPEEHRLLRDGKPTSLTPKAFDLLLFLVRNPERLITKDQIMEAVWPDSFVEEGNITVLISTLRKALGETESGPYITTVPKKGYRFTATVRVGTGTRIELAPLMVEERLQPDLQLAQTPPLDTITPVSTSSKRILIPALALLGAVLAVAGYLAYRSIRPAPRSLAVLPLQNLKSDPESDFLGFSLADAVITKLGFLSSITVRPSSAIQKYRGHGFDPKLAAAELKVDALLTGAFIRDSGRLRITYQLIDVRAYKILYTDSIDLTYDELLTVHDNVSRQIIKALRLNLSPAEAERIRPDTPVNPLAYEYYLRGVDLLGSHNFPLAVRMLEKSVEIDPKYPLTWAYLGQSYTSDAAFELRGREQYRRAQAAYERALALDPKQLEAEIFLANLLVDTGKVEQAVPLLRNALSRDSTNASAHWELGYAYRFAGMLKQSLEECLHALQIDPLVKGNGAALNTYLYLGSYDDFLRSLRGGDEAGFVRFYRGFGEYHQGNLKAALTDLSRAYDEKPTLYTGIGKAFADAIIHKNPEGLQILRQLESEMAERGVGDPEATYKMAQAYAVLGDHTSALRSLRSSIESGFFPYPYFLTDPLLKSLQGLPEFSRVLGIAFGRYEKFKKDFF